MDTKSKLKKIIQEEVRRQLNEEEDLAKFFSYKKDKPDFLNNLVTGEYNWKKADRVINQISDDDSIMRTLKQMQSQSEKASLLMKFAELLGISKSQLSLWGISKMLKK